ncbi:hypothetical protein FRB94_013083 [Tulasnella sp. JGI-2019a]|nr:hypothetical protein FRB94_013083 [Tulasnella sp. JGI-2019a]
MGANTLQNVKASLQVLSAIVNAVPIPEPFKSAVVGIPDAVLQIITIVETAKGNMEDAKVLAIYIATTTERTIRPLDLPRVTPATQNRIREFQEALQQITKEITTLASRRPLRRWIVNYDRDASKLGALKQKVEDVITGIQLETVVATGHEVELLYQEQQVLIRKQQEAEIDRLIALLGTGDSGSSKKPPCMDGTRVSLLKWITRWIEEPTEDGKRGLCLIGAAGRGKSSVGASIAEEERRSKQLGADFYFTVDQQDRNEGVIPVLARQLTSWGDGRLRIEIASALHGDRDLAQRRLEVQFRELIQVPLETLADDINCPALVILLDGLDECSNEHASRLLHLVGQSFTKLPPAVKFIITSRPEPHLLHLYDRDPFDARLVIRSLDMEDAGEVEGDIKEYFRQVLPQMVWGWVKRPSDWPGEERVEILVRLSGGLWIWAVTVARMLADPNFRDPEKQLDALLSAENHPHQVYGHNTDLYTIYSKILDRACPPASHDQLLASFRDVLGALCVVKVPVNIHTLTSLLCLDHPNNGDFTDYIRTRVLGYLQAVLIVPDVNEENLSRDANPIRFIHKSFEDYLTDESRCNARFLVNIAEQHRRMAIRCLCRMDDLQKPNICSIDPTMLNQEVKGYSSDYGMKALVQQRISSALQYACENWPIHVSGASPESDDLYASVDTFARTRLLYWLEVLSLLGMTGQMVELVESVELWLKARPPQVALIPSESFSSAPIRRVVALIGEGFIKMQAGFQLWMNTRHTSSGSLSLQTLNYARRFLVESLLAQMSVVSLQANTSPESDISALSLLQDLKNFLGEFEIPIGDSPPHIYHSALAFTPSHTSLSRVYGHLVENGPRPRRGCLQQWTRRTKQRCVAWSPDGRRIVSGSDDGTLCLWDPSTGAPVGEAWKFHTGVVRCIAWSPDSKMIVSGSDDHSIQLWNSTTGARIGDAWNGHTDLVLSVAWSPDGKRVASGSADHTLRVWDPSTGEPVPEAWMGHTGWLWYVAWSPEGKRIAFRSNDGTIRLWELSTGAVIGKPWEGEYMCVLSLAWSPDGSKIVCGTERGTLRLWDVHTGEPVGDPWKGHIGAVLCVAWSRDGKMVVSGSQDNTLILWDPSTGMPIRGAWNGHTEDVRCLSWSPDGKMIVSGSYDGTLILWNSVTGEPRRLGQWGPNGHIGHVYCLGLAPGSDSVVSISSDGTVRLWDTSSGALVGQPARQTTAVTQLSFSPDCRYVCWEDDECWTMWEVSRQPVLEDGSQSGGTAEVCVLKIDDNGWLRDQRGKRMFWLPVALRPVGDWGRVLSFGNLLAIQISSVPIVDISAYASRID